MNKIIEEQILKIRRFNRDYTAKIGLLEKYVLHSDYTLSESRILLEIDRTDECTAKNISEVLSVDPALVSRTVSKLIHLGLIEKTRSLEDKRAYILQVTDAGIEVMDILHNKANLQILKLIETLSDEEREKIMAGIDVLNELFLGMGSEKPNYITIRNELKAGDIGQLVMMHGDIYSKELGYNVVFESYVCKTFFDAVTKAFKEYDKYWIAECDGKIIGSIAVIAKDRASCQLRWLLVDPKYRGVGLGKKLFGEAMAYAEMHFKKIFLETTEEQSKALELYRSEGFIEVKKYEIAGWGKNLTGITMEKELL